MSNRKRVVSPEIISLLGAGKIVRIVSYKSDKQNKPYRILFSDKKTILEFEGQDPYTYHDCNSSAFMMRVFEDKETWQNTMTDNSFVDAIGLD